MNDNQYNEMFQVLYLGMFISKNKALFFLFFYVGASLASSNPHQPKNISSLS